ncbi:DUF3800 domain-containing protein [Actinobacillus porcinus]|uniref:DUF3800 domain-containing protein n=1 Tax=Actinobacillus porcinus TaxID=51048 RepID=UPI0023556378|nr:DUF3800 domain-containing protein [Actinobacillus porcinus]MDD7545608.1 DUF3800 domain-containing protein [Actinobacillus porcinus]MDY5847599.1 DUF3800 domain-containing protein [Actinobacillus porcinus]
MQISVYLDESGDLGWKFDAPYRSGGSSRYLTIAAVLINHEKRHLLKRLMRDLYRRTKTPSNEEVKWAKLSVADRLWVAEKIAQLKSKLGADLQILCITTKKEKVMPHIRRDPNKLYNYMIKLLLARELSRHDEVLFNVDQRSIKVESGNSLHDYLQTFIWFELGSQTVLNTIACDSKCHLGVQVADIISGIVQNHFEDNKSEPYKVLRLHSEIRTLYF